jgi:hypothetical protein
MSEDAMTSSFSQVKICEILHGLMAQVIRRGIMGLDHVFPGAIVLVL